MEYTYGVSPSPFVPAWIRSSCRIGLPSPDGPHGTLMDSPVASRTDRTGWRVYAVTKQDLFYSSGRRTLFSLPWLGSSKTLKSLVGVSWIHQRFAFWLSGLLRSWGKRRWLLVSLHLAAWREYLSPWFFTIYSYCSSR